MPALVPPSGSCSTHRLSFSSLWPQAASYPRTGGASGQGEVRICGNDYLFPSLSPTKKTKPPPPTPSAPSAARGVPASFASPALAEKLEKLGITREFDLILHLPLRYEDETRITPLRDCVAGVPAQVEVEVEHGEVAYRPRRQLVVKCHEVGTRGGALLYLRFLNFYTSQIKQLQPGKRLRLFGEVKPGFFGAEMIHPRYHVVAADTPVPEAMTPVYPTTAGLSQYQLRTLIERALKHAEERGTLNDTLPPSVTTPLRLASFASSVKTLHHPPPDASLASLSERTHPAWQRLKFDELLAQQLAMRLAHLARRAKAAPRLSPGKALTQKLIKSLPFALTRAQHRAFAEIRARSRRGASDATPAAGRCRQRQDHCRGAGCAAGDRKWLPVRRSWRRRKFSPNSTFANSPIDWSRSAFPRLAHRQPNARERRESKAKIADGSAQLVVGTHALFQEDVEFKTLGPRHRRRAASFRRRPAPRAAPESQGRAASADDERHPDPAYAVDELLRRSRRIGDRRTAAGTPAHRHQAYRRLPARRGHQHASATACNAGARRTGFAR